MAADTSNRQVSNWLNKNLDFNPDLTDSQWGNLGSGLMDWSKGWSDYFSKEATAKSQRAYQNYSNSMVDLSNSANQDAITLNEIQYIDVSTQQAKSIQTSGMTAAGSVEANAAGAGVRGNSVQVNMTHVEGSAASAEYNREREFKYAMLGFDQQRRSSAMFASMQKKHSTFAGGSLLQAGFGAMQSVGTMVGAFL